jgi:hypothetical protein
VVIGVDVVEIRARRIHIVDHRHRQIVHPDIFAQGRARRIRLGDDAVVEVVNIADDRRRT